MNNKMIIIYGAGKLGEKYYKFLENQGLQDNVQAFCDKNAENIRKKFNKEVFIYSEAKMKGIPFLIGISKKSEGYFDVKEILEADSIYYYKDLQDYMFRVAGMSSVEFNRAYCAYYHIEYMDDYFQSVDNESSLQVFWGEKSEFLPMFNRLNLDNVIELACGRGRHVPKYMNRANEITLVDILDKNIAICRERFKGNPKIHYYKNNGFDLSELPSNKYSALFTYDAMVHFELLDVFNYLKETQRVLIPGGMALFHHSNTDSNYKISFEHSVSQGRNFMSKKLFAYLAYRAGLEIVEQKVIDWDVPDLDCITLVRKI